MWKTSQNVNVHNPNAQLIIIAQMRCDPSTSKSLGGSKEKHTKVFPGAKKDMCNSVLTGITIYLN